MIVDEIHALARDKRGAHLALSLERLDALCERRPQRIGLSATQRPIETIARLLVGAGEGRTRADGAPACRDRRPRASPRPRPRPSSCPRATLEAVASHEQWGEILDRIAGARRASTAPRSSSSTRAGWPSASRTCSPSALGEDRVAAHHGSLSKERRLRARGSGSARASCGCSWRRRRSSSASTSARSTSSARSARRGASRRSCSASGARATRAAPRPRAASSDHARRAGRVRGAAARRARGPARPRPARRWRRSTSWRSRSWPACAGEAWAEDELFALVRRAAPYAELAARGLRRRGRDARRGRPDRARPARARWLHRDRVNGVLRGRARRAHRRAHLRRRHPRDGRLPRRRRSRRHRRRHGQRGLGHREHGGRHLPARQHLVADPARRGRRRARGGRAGRAADVPFWLGEAPARTAELSAEVSATARATSARASPRDDAPGALAWLERECGLGGVAAAADRRLPRRRRSARSASCPTQRRRRLRALLRRGGRHAARRARAVRRAREPRLRPRAAQALLPPLRLRAAGGGERRRHRALARAAAQLPARGRAALRHAAHGAARRCAQACCSRRCSRRAGAGTSAARSWCCASAAAGASRRPSSAWRPTTCWRRCSRRSRGCQENAGAGPVEIPDHPLVRQTVHDCLHEAMDVDGLRGAARAHRGRRACALHVATRPSRRRSSHEILNGRPYTFLDDAPLEERRTRAVALRRGLPETRARSRRASTPTRSRACATRRGPTPRDAEELHDALLELVVAARPSARVGGRGSTSWCAAGRAARVATAGGRALAAPRSGARPSTALFPGARVEPDVRLPAARRGARPRDVDEEAAAVAAVRGHLAATGARARRPSSPARTGLAARPRSSRRSPGSRPRASRCAAASIRRAPAPTATSSSASGACSRASTATRTERLRREIEPVTRAGLHALPAALAARGARTRSARAGAGVLAVIEQLQGFEIAAGAWEETRAARARRRVPPRVARRPLPLRRGRVGAPRGARRRGDAGGEARRRPRRRGAVARHADRASRCATTCAWLLARGARRRAAGAARRRRGARRPRRAAHARGALLRRPRRRHGAAPRRGGGGAVGPRRRAASSPPTASAACARSWPRASAGRKRAASRAAGGCAAARASPWWARRAAGRSCVAGAARRRGRRRRETLAEAVAEQLLARYGVVFRDLALRETLAVPWREVLWALRRLEARGTARGGRFVTGFVGEQYALPEAVEALRQTRAPRAHGRDRAPRRRRPAEPGGHHHAGTARPRHPRQRRHLPRRPARRPAARRGRRGRGAARAGGTITATPNDCWAVCAAILIVRSTGASSRASGNNRR